jgi:hypothetical protein
MPTNERTAAVMYGHINGDFEETDKESLPVEELGVLLLVGAVAGVSTNRFFEDVAMDCTVRCSI